MVFFSTILEQGALKIELQETIRRVCYVYLTGMVSRAEIQR